MSSHRRVWSWSLLAVGVLGCAGYLKFPDSGTTIAVWYLVTAALGTGMAFTGARWAAPPRRRIWVALAAGQVLYLVGDAFWEYYEHVLHVLPYPSWGDAAYLLRYGAFVLGLCWLVRGRQVGRDRAAFLDAAILTSAFALPATLFLIVPAASGSDASLLGSLVAAAYPVGDVLILAVLLRLVMTPAARNPAFFSLTSGLLLLLATDVYYTVLASSGALLPRWVDASYLLTYLLLGFAAMHPSSSALTEPTARDASRPVAAKVVTLGCASLLAPVLLATEVLTHSDPDPLVIAIGGAVSSLLVLVRLSDLLRYSESQSVQLAELARTDGLTGVPNRRTWDHQLARASDDARAEGTSLTVAMIDLDHFKVYNDTHGHLAGDLALKETAAAWAHLLDGHGYLARYGGEEFAVFIPGPARDGAEALLDRIHRTVARGQTCSIGAAEWQRGEQGAQAMARADEALYEAKRTGRNRTVWCDAEGRRHLSSGAPAATSPKTNGPRADPVRPLV